MILDKKANALELTDDEALALIIVLTKKLQERRTGVIIASESLPIICTDDGITHYASKFFIDLQEQAS